MAGDYGCDFHSRDPKLKDGTLEVLIVTARVKSPPGYLCVLRNSIMLCPPPPAHVRQACGSVPPLWRLAAPPPTAPNWSLLATRVGAASRRPGFVTMKMIVEMVQTNFAPRAALRTNTGVPVGSASPGGTAAMAPQTAPMAQMKRTARPLDARRRSSGATTAAASLAGTVVTGSWIVGLVTPQTKRVSLPWEFFGIWVWPI